MGLDEIEQLEEIGEAEDTDRRSRPLDLDAVPWLKTLTASYDRAYRPVMVLDRSLNIIYRNSQFNASLGRFYRLDELYFPAVFQASIDNDTVGGLCRALASAEGGYSWKGEFTSKTKASTTVYTRVYINPLFLAEIDPERPVAYSVLFDDMTTEKRQMLRTMFMSLLEASKLKDNDTGRHIERVNLYSRRIAEELYDRPEYPQVDMDYLDNISFLASMHDVGKIGTPDDILNKAGPLTPWEWDIMKEHTINGAFILSTYPNPMAREIALSHHEMWDGKGYPYHLEGLMIPLSARIVTIADVYDALRTRRSYKPSYDHETAVEKILQWRGSHFDPAIVDVFVRVKDECSRIYDENADEQPAAEQAAI